MTLQQIFDNAYRGYVYDGRAPGYSPASGSCVYRDVYGHRCAIGLSLPEDPDVAYGQSTVLDLLREEPFRDALGLTERDAGMIGGLLQALQTVHDGAAQDLYGEHEWLRERDAPTDGDPWDSVPEGVKAQWAALMRVDLTEFAQMHGLSIPTQGVTP